MPLKIVCLGALVCSIAAGASAFASSFYDVEQALQSGNTNEARSMIRKMRAAGFQADDMDKLEALVKVVDDEADFSRNAAIYTKVPNSKTYSDTKDSYAKLVGLTSFSGTGIKIGGSFLEALDSKLVEDKARMATIASDFEPQRRQIEAQEAREQAEQARLDAEQRALAAAQARQQAIEAAVEKKRMEKEAADANAREARYQAELEDRKRHCGGELDRPRIGMSQAMLLECVPYLRLMSETNRSDGVLAIFMQPTGMRVYVIDGRVASWSR